MKTQPRVDIEPGVRRVRYIEARCHVWGVRVIEGMGATLTRQCRHVRGAAACRACIEAWFTRMTRDSFHYPPGKWTTSSEADIAASNAASIAASNRRAKAAR